jgi:cytochrome c-type biogenesis protein CcmE
MENAIAEASVWPRPARIAATALAVAGSVGLLIVAARGPEPRYYKHVYEVTASPETWRGRHLLIHGRVVPGSIEQARGTQRYRFKIESCAPEPPAILNVVYSGEVPDAFRSGAQVVVTGQLTRDDVLDVVPDGIMAKCPSKFSVD